MGKAKNAKQKLINQHIELKKKIESIELDTHWFRRVFHTSATSFLLYYMLPDEALFKFYIPLLLIISIIIIEAFRLKRKIDDSYFFGLRIYEKNRPASYLYFTIAVITLLVFFPQQIAIPCILCACFTDPIIGELRYHLGKKETYIVGFLVCMFFFMVIWIKADIWIILLVSIIGATGAIVGEAKKLKLIDDDFMIQMLPAIFLIILWFVINAIGIDIIPDPIIPLGVIAW